MDSNNDSDGGTVSTSNIFSNNNSDGGTVTTDNTLIVKAYSDSDKDSGIPIVVGGD